MYKEHTLEGTREWKGGCAKGKGEEASQESQEWGPNHVRFGRESSAAIRGLGQSFK